MVKRKDVDKLLYWYRVWKQACDEELEDTGEVHTQEMAIFAKELMRRKR